MRNYETRNAQNITNNCFMKQHNETLQVSSQWANFVNAKEVLSE